MYSEISSAVQCGNVEGKCAICQVTGLPAKCQRGVPCLHTTSRACRGYLYLDHISHPHYLHNIYTVSTLQIPSIPRHRRTCPGASIPTNIPASANSQFCKAHQDINLIKMCVDVCRRRFMQIIDKWMCIKPVKPLDTWQPYRHYNYHT